MSNFSLANSLSASVRIYRALLVAYPKMFREHYETHMVQVFRDSFRDAYHRNGLTGVMDLWLHTFADLLVTALMERMLERSQYMFSPKVTLWGGIASICGGLFWTLAAFQSSGAGPLELGLALGLGGLAGLYSRQGGKLALAGFVLGILGTGLALAALWWGFASGRFSDGMDRNPTLGAPPLFMLALGIAILGIGLVLLGVTSLRATTPHIWRALPLSIGLLGILQSMVFWLFYYLPLSQGQNPWNPWNIGVYVLYPAVHVLSGVGWMGLGVMLAIDGDAKGALPPRVSAKAR